MIILVGPSRHGPGNERSLAWSQAAEGRNYERELIRRLGSEVAGEGAEARATH